MSERDRKKLQTRYNNALEGIKVLTDSNGYSISDTFQRLPSRTGTDYYKTIKNPVSLHIMGLKVKRHEYTGAQEFIRDLAQICWNARFYNQKGSFVYNQALILEEHIKDKIIPKLAQDKVVPHHNELQYPDLGPLPDDDGIGGEVFNSVPDMGMKDEAYEDINPFGRRNMDDDEEYEEYPSYTPQPRLPISSRPKTAQYESGTRRGRPPTVDRPHESRIKLILKSIKKISGPNEMLFNIDGFDRLPDRNSYPEYYRFVETPICLNDIRIKLRSKKYKNVDEFLSDLNLLFYDLKTFHGGIGSTSYDDVVNCEQEVGHVVTQELLRSEQEVMELTNPGGDGRIPLDLVEVNGYNYKVGDWVLINNPNEPEKPTVGQIFRLWSLKDGTKYFNACWYYRPEQTVHRFDRLFFLNEVCKTGQYRDHFVNEIVGPCYVVFVTRYQKGDLDRNMVPDGCPWFICEFRYNENSHVFNRIRTWKACLPDAVRDAQEPPIIPLNEPRKLIKFESPIKGMLLNGSNENSPVPPVTEGPHQNAPPLRGSVYVRRPDTNDDLGQYYTSPHVTPYPENDDLVNGRKAYLFTPVSQAKSSSFPTASGLAMGTGAAMGSLTGAPGLLNNPMMNPGTPSSAYNNYGAVNNSYYQPPSNMVVPSPPQEFGFKPPMYQSSKTFQSMQQKYKFDLQKKQSSPLATNYHTTTSTYSNVLPGGTLAYLITDEKNLVVISERIIKKAKVDAERGDKKVDIVWFRSPPVSITNKIISEKFNLGHSAKYLAWKSQQNNL